MITVPATLASAARAIVATPDLDEKVALSYAAAKAWFANSLSVGARVSEQPMPDRPGRPERPLLLPPRDMPRRAVGGTSGKIAMVHALAHIELNAVDLMWDMIGRFFDAPAPRSFLDDFVQVGLEEAKHFSLLKQRLTELGAAYGDLPAHDGLWQAAHATKGSVLARVAIIPLVLEARGLDVTPGLTEKARAAGDDKTAAILDVIYRDEKRHVAFGLRWFRYFCEREGLELEATFHALVRAHFRGGLKPPFNDRARSEAGLAPGFYKPLAPMAGR